MLTVLLLFYIVYIFLLLTYMCIIYKCVSFSNRRHNTLFYNFSRIYTNYKNLFYVFGIDLMGAVAVLYYNSLILHCNSNLIYKFTLLLAILVIVYDIINVYDNENYRFGVSISENWQFLNKSIFTSVCVGGKIRNWQVHLKWWFMDKEQ